MFLTVFMCLARKTHNRVYSLETCCQTKPVGPAVPATGYHTALELRRVLTFLNSCITHCFVVVGCVRLFDPVDCSPLGSSLRGILQARTLEWSPLHPPRDVPDSGTEPVSLAFPALAGNFLPLHLHHILSFTSWLSKTGTFSIWSFKRSLPPPPCPQRPAQKG